MHHEKIMSRHAATNDPAQMDPMALQGSAEGYSTAYTQLQQSPENKASAKHRKHEGLVVILGQLKDSQLVTEEKGNLTTYIESQRLRAVDLLVPVDSNQGITLLVQ